MKTLSAHPVLQGSLVILRAPQESDKSDQLARGYNAEFRRLVGGDSSTLPPLTSAEVENWYAQVSADPLYWIVEAAKHCIGTARLHSLDAENRRVRDAIDLFNPDFGDKAMELKSPGSSFATHSRN